MPRIGGLLIALAFASAPGRALGWNEAVDGDLSSDPAAPTPLSFVVGDNVVAGSITSSAPSDTRDYLTFTIPQGRRLAAVRLMTWQDLPGGGPGNRGFHAINAGATSFSPSTTTEASFLGGDHVDPVPSGTDLLPELADGDTAGSGFALPLGPGTYSYVIQQTGTQRNGYELRFSVTSVPAVPSAPAWAPALLAGLLLLTGLLAQLGSARRAR